MGLQYITILTVWSLIYLRESERRTTHGHYRCCRIDIPNPNSQPDPQNVRAATKQHQKQKHAQSHKI
jgi:hypothetical protein